MILTRPAYDKAFRKLSPARQGVVRAALLVLPEVFGRPHLHRGIGIRPFGGFYECRAGLETRIIFLWSKGDFVLTFVGDHRAVANWIKSR